MKTLPVFFLLFLTVTDIRHHHAFSMLPHELDRIQNDCCVDGRKAGSCRDYDFHFSRPYLPFMFNQLCKNIFEGCCFAEKTAEMCLKGRSFAWDGADCNQIPTTNDHEKYWLRTCCTSCRAGMEHAPNCDFAANLEAPNDLDRAFFECCQEKNHRMKQRNQPLHIPPPPPSPQQPVHPSHQLPSVPVIGEGGHPPMSIPRAPYVQPPLMNPPINDELRDEGDDVGPPQEGEIEKASPPVNVNPSDPCVALNCSMLCNGEKCDCSSGYRLQSDGRTCLDIDECGEGKPCHLDESCKNLIGSYECSPAKNRCPDGQRWNEQSQDCFDIANVDDSQELVETQTAIIIPAICTETSCPENHTCIEGTNGDGGFSCEPCGNGYAFVDGRCADIDECASTPNPCSLEDQECINAPGEFSCVPKQSIRAEQVTEDNDPDGEQTPKVEECDEGYVEIDGSCEDIDECEMMIANCDDDEKCINEEGSYKCERIDCGESKKFRKGECIDKDACEPGYQFSNETNDCADVDECLIKTTCPENHICFNKPGSYECVNNTCDPGFQMSDGFFGGYRCKDIDECSEGRDNCTEAADCVNVEGSFKCECKKGFKQNDATGICEDIDECTSDNDCDRLTNTCRNIIGSYECDCRDGFEKSIWGSCTDIDECKGISTCPSKAECVNLPGSYECRCPDGMHMDESNTTCIAELPDLPCHGLMRKEDRCDCPTGFKVQGRESSPSVLLTCGDIDECDFGNHTCSDSSICVNTFGGFECMEIKCDEEYDRKASWCIHKNLDKKCFDDHSNCHKNFDDPATISYSFVTMHNNASIGEEGEVIYTMTRLTPEKTVSIIMNEEEVMPLKSGVRPADWMADFKFEKMYRGKSANNVDNFPHLILLKPLEGPQRIVLRFDVSYAHLKIVHQSFLHIYVSEYNEEVFVKDHKDV